MPMVPAVVDIVIDSAHAGSAKANILRVELRDLGVRDGFAGFRFEIPSRFRDGKTHHVTVTERVSKSALSGIGVFKLELEKDSGVRSDLFLSSVVLEHTINAPSFSETLHARKKLAILSAFTPHNDLLGYHHALIAALQAAGFAVLLGQAYASMPAANARKPVSQADAFLVKDNLGYDFGTWFACLAAVRPHLATLDELLLLNDSVFGPMCSPQALADMIASCRGDLVGICDSYEHNYHLQSFFLLFRKNVLQSKCLEQFANAYSYSNTKTAVVQDGELALTPWLQERGFHCEAVFSYERLARRWLDRVGGYVSLLEKMPEFAGEKDDDVQQVLGLARKLRRGEPVNPSHLFWDVLLDMDCPFVKRELLLKNPMNAPLLFRAPELIHAAGYSLGHVREAAQRYGATRVMF